MSTPKKSDTPNEFELARLDAHLTNNKAAEVLGVTIRTVMRWKASHAPAWASYILRVYAGHLPWPGWEGWQVQHGHLFQPGFTRHGIKPGEIAALPYIHQLLKEQERCIREFNNLHDQAKTSQEIPISMLLKNHNG